MKPQDTDKKKQLEAALRQNLMRRKQAVKSEIDANKPKSDKADQPNDKAGS